MIDFDFSELDGLASDLAAAPQKLRTAARATTERAARAVARDARSLFEGQRKGPFLPHYGASITSEMTGPLEAEAGPETGKPQGGMGAGVEFGSVHTSPMPHMIPAINRQEAKYENALADDAERSL